MGDTVVWISGASSGIGAALAASVPYPDARVIGMNRRRGAHGEHLGADLSNPAAWPDVAAHFTDVLGRGDVASAVFLHFAGVAPPVGPVAGADAGEYTAAVLLNAASGQVLGQAFLQACRRTSTESDARAVLIPGRGDARLRGLPLRGRQVGPAVLGVRGGARDRGRPRRRPRRSGAWCWTAARTGRPSRSARSPPE